MWIQLEDALINTNQVVSIEPVDGGIEINLKDGTSYVEGVERWEQLKILSDREILEMCKNHELAVIYAPRE